MTGHDHSAGFDSITEDPTGRSVDQQLLNRLIGAAFDGCQPCQQAEIDKLVTQPTSTARLVELTCLAVQERLGGLPPVLLNASPAGSPDASVSTEFRTLARVGVHGANQRMFWTVVEYSEQQRRAAVDDALTLLVGQMSILGVAEGR